MTEPKELFNCHYCNAEVPELHLKDEEGRGLCGVCMNTVPREWGDDVIGEWRLRGNGTLVLLKATNHNTNFILTAIEGLCEEVAALKADDGRVERTTQLTGARLDAHHAYDVAFSDGYEKGKADEAARPYPSDLYNSMHATLTAFIRAYDMADIHQGEAAMSDAYAFTVAVLERVEGKGEKTAERASPQVTDAERKRVREVLKQAVTKHSEDISYAMFATLLYGMSELVADARAGKP